MKNIMGLMVTQKKSKHKLEKSGVKSTEPNEPMIFIPYINYGLIFKENQSYITRELIMTDEDKKVKDRHPITDRDYISNKILHEQRIHLSTKQNKQLINYTLKLIMPEKIMNQFKKQGMTIKQISDHFMVHTDIIYMRLNLIE
jgi:hypothetical protein